MATSCRRRSFVLGSIVRLGGSAWSADDPVDANLAGQFRWTCGPALVGTRTA